MIMIDNIKFGIKIKANEFHLLPTIYDNREIIDFIEVLIRPDFAVDDLVTINKFILPYSIHFPHLTNNIDFGNIKHAHYNQEFIERIRSNKKIFDSLTPLCYIVHPESGDVQLSISNLKKLKVKPLALENMPYKFETGGYRLAHTAEAIKPFFNAMPDLELCLDLNHAIKTAVCTSLDSIEVIKNFIKIKKPLHFHIADGNMNSQFDEHLSIGEGSYDISKIKALLLDLDSDVYLTFETPRLNKIGIEDDLKNIRAFIES